MTTKITKRNRYDQSQKLNLDAALPPLELQHVWYEMKKLPEWASVALVPVTDKMETLSIAHGLGLMAIREPHHTVWVVNASNASGNIVQPSDVNKPNEKDFPYKFVNLADLGITKEKQLFTVERILEKLAEQEGVKMRFIVAVDSIIDNTHPIALCRSVDGVILCTALEKTTFKAVRRAVEIIGREKIIGSIVLRPKAA